MVVCRILSLFAHWLSAYAKVVQPRDGILRDKIAAATMISSIALGGYNSSLMPDKDPLLQKQADLLGHLCSIHSIQD